MEVVRTADSLVVRPGGVQAAHQGFDSRWERIWFRIGDLSSAKV
jgi:hypothetical protein